MIVISERASIISFKLRARIFLTTQTPCAVNYRNMQVRTPAKKKLYYLRKGAKVVK